MVENRSARNRVSLYKPSPDDEPINASIVEMILKSNGFDATSLIDPPEALWTTHSEAPDLLVSDVILPFLSGIERAARIKAFCPDCRVLHFSGNATVLNDSAQLETCEILPKTVHPEALLKMIHGPLDSTQSSASPSLADQASAPKWPDA